MPESKHFNEHIKEAKQMYQKGASLEDVAKHFNVFRGTVSYHFNKNNIKIRSLDEANRYSAKWIGRKYGHLTVIDWSTENKNNKKRTLLKLKCKCGTIISKYSDSSSIRQRNRKWIQSCSKCLLNTQLEERWKFILGKKSGSRTVRDLKYEFSKAKSTPWKIAFLKLECDCGSVEWQKAVSVNRRLNGLRRPYANYCKKCRPKPNPRINTHGYRLIFSPNQKLKHVNNRGMILEHIFVMCESLGRELNSSENVHHINGDKLDNRLENLELWDTSQPKGQRLEDKIEHYKNFLTNHGYKITK